MKVRICRWHDTILSYAVATFSVNSVILTSLQKKGFNHRVSALDWYFSQYIIDAKTTQSLVYRLKRSPIVVSLKRREMRANLIFVWKSKTNLALPFLIL